MIIDCNLQLGNTSFSLYCLVDSGATGFALNDKGFALKQNLHLNQLQSRRGLEVIDGRPISSGHITYLATVFLNINGHRETLQFFVTRLGHYPMGLRIHWLKRHDVTLQVRENRVLFSSTFCKQNCFGKQTWNTQKGPTALLTSSNTQVHKSEVEKAVFGGRHLSRFGTPVTPKKRHLYISMVRNTLFSSLVKKKKLQVYLISIEEVNQVQSLLS